jgi:hypothetical protein
MGSDEVYSLDCIVKVADYFPDIEKSDSANRAIGRMITDDTQQASEYFQIVLDMATTRLSKFYTYACLTTLQYKARNYESAILAAQICLTLHSFRISSTVEEPEQNIYTKNLYDVFRVLGDSF